MTDTAGGAERPATAEKTQGDENAQPAASETHTGAERPPGASPGWEVRGRIDERLGQPLDRAAIKVRDAGQGRKLSYIETHHAIRTANEIFGFGGWGHEVMDLRPLAAVEVKGKDGKEGWHVGYICIVRVSVEGRLVTSGVGYGDATEYRSTALVTAHELAAKEAESDALKRALKNYGDQFGLALYDKDADRAGHLSEIAERQPEPPKVARAKNWTELAERLAALGVPPDDSVVWFQQAKDGRGIDTSGKEGQDTMFRAANDWLVAVTLAGEVDFAADPRPVLRSLHAGAFKLAAEADGPPWRIGPAEEARPTREEHELAQIEAASPVPGEDLDIKF